MQCNQLIRLIKGWYIHVKEETMAPARMMQFVDKHVNECEVCQEDIGIQEEIEKIREFILPESKIPKAVRIRPDRPTPEISDEGDEMEDQEDDEYDDEMDDEDEDENEDEDEFDDDLDDEDDLDGDDLDEDLDEDDLDDLDD